MSKKSDSPSPKKSSRPAPKGGSTSRTTSSTRKRSTTSSTGRRKKSSKGRTSSSGWLKTVTWLLFKWGSLIGLLLSVPFSIWVWSLNQSLVAHFEGQKWQVPSEVYSAPIHLRAGDPWRKKDLEQRLEEAGYRFGSNSQEVGWAARSTTRISAHLRPFADQNGQHPAARRIFSFDGGVLQIQRLDGEYLADAWLEPQLIGHLYGTSTESRAILTREEIPTELVQALIAVEDREFFDHWGISLKGIARAVWVNLLHGEKRQGGSTLTQQLIKNMYLTSERSYTRKLQEVIMAILLEYRFSKDEILTAYVNEVYLAQFGKQAIHGFEAASQYFYNRPLAELNLDEVALLVGMVKGPSVYNPARHPQRAKDRRDTVLALMHEQGTMSDSAYRQALQRPVRVQPGRRSRSLYGDYLDLVAFQLEQDFDREALVGGNLKIYTGLDVWVQQAAVSSLQQQVKELERSDASLASLQGALVVTDPGNGQVKALVGSSRSLYSGFNRALGAVRPIGSLVKPPLYLSAIASGRFNWLTSLNDQRVRFQVGGNIWEPENYDHQTHGAVPMYQAMAKSYNLATLDLAQKIGFDRVGQNLRQLGVERPFTMLPAVALGALELSPMEVARLFQPIASAGQSSQLGIVSYVKDQSGKLLKKFESTQDVPFTNAVLAVVRDGMTKTAEIGTARKAQAAFPTLRFAAKTGTTNQQRDSWFVGITGNYSTTIWLGDDENRPLSITGSSGAQTVWIRLMKALNPISIPAQLPDGAIRLQVSNSDFALAADRCEEKTQLAFLQGTEPTDTQYCIWSF